MGDVGDFKSLICSWPGKSWAKVVALWRKIAKIGKDDPRRIIHSLKVGLAVTLVSLLYYYNPVYDSFGVNAIWAVITAVFVVEFSVGATIGKGLNRTLGTTVGCVLGFGANYLTTLSGDTGKPILIAIFIFIFVALASFARFFPLLKARYDYGLLIFNLTFSLILTSGYRNDEILEVARDRLLTVILGCSIIFLVMTCIYPVWIGEDLHNLVAANLDKLGTFLQGCGVEDGKSNGDMSSLQDLNSVLTSKGGEDNMVNFARWEPGHGRFRYGHPWKQYMKIATLTRQCAYKIDALHSHLSKSATDNSREIQKKVGESCSTISSECGKALKELSSSIIEMTKTNLDALHIENSKVVAENLKSIIAKEILGEAEVDLVHVMPVTRLASLLLELIDWIHKLGEAVHELAFLAGFKNLDTLVLTESVAQILHLDLDNSHTINIGE